MAREEFPSAQSDISRDPIPLLVSQSHVEDLSQRLHTLLFRRALLQNFPVAPNSLSNSPDEKRIVPHDPLPRRVHDHLGTRKWSGSSISPLRRADGIEGVSLDALL